MAVALALSIGLHWAFLQSLAWTTMLVDNLATSSFSTALQRTFDGKHPCALCKVVAEGRKSEKKADTVLQIRKFEGLSASVAIAIPPPASFPLIESPSTSPAAFSHSPPVPPPRAA
ncbi:MAG: hypothetical protein NT154_15950 [Verrucomicrobia bacterium]|nr:hypothetical protein [Verrucomicrobiota bacterium]